MANGETCEAWVTTEHRFYRESFKVPPVQFVKQAHWLHNHPFKRYTLYTLSTLQPKCSVVSSSDSPPQYNTVLNIKSFSPLVESGARMLGNGQKCTP